MGKVIYEKRTNTDLKSWMPKNQNKAQLFQRSFLRFSHLVDLGLDQKLNLLNSSEVVNK